MVTISPIASSWFMTSSRIIVVAVILLSPSATRSRISAALRLRSSAFCLISSSVIDIVLIAAVESSMAASWTALSATSVVTWSLMSSMALTARETESFICSNSREMDSMFALIWVVAAAVLVAESLMEYPEEIAFAAVFFTTIKNLFISETMPFTLFIRSIISVLPLGFITPVKSLLARSEENALTLLMFEVTFAVLIRMNMNRRTPQTALTAEIVV